MPVEPVSETGNKQESERPTFCEAVLEYETAEGLDEIRCTDRYGHEEAHSAKVWWSR